MASMQPDQHFPYFKGMDPKENAAGDLIGWSAAMVVLSGIAVILRFVARYLVRQPGTNLHVEDWLALAALPFAWIMCFVSIWGATHDSFGYHIGASTPISLRRFLIGLWVFEHAYNFVITLAKLSIIALWWRIFDVRSCHICLVAIGVLEVMWLIAAELVQVFSCVPISGFWNLSIPSQCIVQSRYWIGAAVPNIAFDIVLLILPNFWIMKLNINTSQKLALCFVFMLGIFVTVCSSLRLWQLILYNGTSTVDLTYTMVKPAIWSLVEGNLSVVCCCLPSMRPLLRLLIHGRLAYGYDYSRNNRCLNGPNPMPLQGPDLERATPFVPLKPIPTAKVIDSPTSPMSPRNDAQRWPLPPRTDQKAKVYPEGPVARPAGPRVDSSSTLTFDLTPTASHGDGSGSQENLTWLDLNNTPSTGSARAVSELQDVERGDVRNKGKESVGPNSPRQSRKRTSLWTDYLRRHPSAASFGAPTKSPF